MVGPTEAIKHGRFIEKLVDPGWFEVHFTDVGEKQSLVDRLHLPSSVQWVDAYSLRSSLLPSK